MKSRNVYFYVAAALAIVVPVPGRFAFGFLMVLLFNVQVITGILFCHVISVLKLDDLKNVLVSIEQISVTILFKQWVILCCPVAAFTLGFLMYLPALSSVVIEFSYKDNSLSLGEDLHEKGMRNLIFSVAVLVIALLRDIIGYGTITFPAWDTLAAVHVTFFERTTYAGAFLATIPGALVLVALILAGYLYVQNQFDTFGRLDGQGERHA